MLLLLLLLLFYFPGVCSVLPRAQTREFPWKICKAESSSWGSSGALGWCQGAVLKDQGIFSHFSLLMASDMPSVWNYCSFQHRNPGRAETFQLLTFPLFIQPMADPKQISHQRQTWGTKLFSNMHFWSKHGGGFKNLLRINKIFDRPDSHFPNPHRHFILILTLNSNIDEKTELL